jgi:hypothetical protein
MFFVRKVVDSNALRDKLLTKYLEASPKHQAVLTEYVLLEAHKRNASSTIAASMEILSRFPKQVVVVRGSEALLGMRGNASGLQRRLIDREMTAEFPRLCARADEAARGNAKAQDEIANAAWIAERHMDSLLSAAPTFLALFEIQSKRFTPAELQHIHQRKPYTEGVQNKLLDMVFDIAVQVSKGAGVRPTKVRPSEIMNLPVFRYSLCMALLFTRWVADGRPQERKPSRTINDVVDMNVASYATYFDGVLSKDKKLKSVYNEARYLLSQIQLVGPTDE